MPCGGCAKRRQARLDKVLDRTYMNNRQLQARLAAYKKRHCTQCEKAETCTYEKYVACKETPNK